MTKILVIFFIFTFCQSSSAETNFDGFVNTLKESRKLKLTIDFESTAKQFGYNNFEQFVDEYKTKFDLEDLTVGEAKEFLIGADRSIEIVETEENLKKLHTLIINNKYLKRDAYFKKKRYNNAKVLAVYLDYEKEMSKITQNPNLDRNLDRVLLCFRH